MSQDWYVDRNGKALGPISASQLKQLASAGKIDRSTPVRRGEDGAWNRAAKLQGLFPASELVPAPEGRPNMTPAAPKPKLNAIIPAPDVRIVNVQQAKPCPFCGESIAATAIKCRYCNEFLDGRPRDLPSAPAPVLQPVYHQPPVSPVINITQVTNIGMRHKRWSRLVAAILSFIIPGLGQIYKGQLFNGLAWLVIVVIGYLVFVVPGAVLHVLCILGAMMGDPHR